MDILEFSIKLFLKLFKLLSLQTNYYKSFFKNILLQHFNQYIKGIFHFLNNIHISKVHILLSPLLSITYPQQSHRLNPNYFFLKIKIKLLLILLIFLGNYHIKHLEENSLSNLRNKDHTLNYYFHLFLENTLLYIQYSFYLYIFYNYSLGNQYNSLDLNKIHLNILSK